MFVRHLVPWPSVDIVRILRRSSQGNPPSGGLNARGVAVYSDFGPIEAITRKWCKIGDKLVLIINRKSHMSFPLVPNSVTLNDPERRNGRYHALFHRIQYLSGRVT